MSSISNFKMAANVQVFLLLSGLCLAFSSSDVRERMCRQFGRCYYTSPVCKFLFIYYECLDFEGFDDIEPDCGLSTFPATTQTDPAVITPKIINGIDAEDGEFPWMVYLSSMCGGVVVDKTTVITAAHCALGSIDRPSSLVVGYGSVNRTAQKTVQVEQIYVHPWYNSTVTDNDNDIAVLKLSEPLPLSAETNLRSICLPRPARSYESGRSCVITGWGQLKEGGVILPIILKKATVPLVPQDLCKSLLSHNDNIRVTERQLCAGYLNTGEADSCLGDSGGPLICAHGDKWVLEGIVSIGLKCGRPLFPGVYTFVPQYVTWIKCLMG